MTLEATDSKKRWTKQDLIDNLLKGGLKEGDTAVIYSSIMDFGVPQLNGEHICHFYLDALFRVLGENGILVITAYTYSFCDGKDFDPWTTRSTVNVIANYCIDNGIGVRTVDPVFSYLLVTLHDLRLFEHYQRSKLSQNHKGAAVQAGFFPFSCLENAPYSGSGSCAENDECCWPAPPEVSQYNLVRTLSFTNDCLRFDEPSITSFLLARKARYVMLGWCYYMTFIHNVERRDGNAYRFLKSFTGKVKTRFNGSWDVDAEDYTCYYYVRVFCPNTVADKRKCFQALCRWPDFDAGPDSCVYLPLGASWMICASLEYMIANIEKCNREDPLWYCTGPELSDKELLALKSGMVEECDMDIRTYRVVDLNDRWK